MKYFCKNEDKIDHDMTLLLASAGTILFEALKCLRYHQKNLDNGWTDDSLRHENHQHIQPKTDESFTRKPVFCLCKGSVQCAHRQRAVCSEPLLLGGVNNVKHFVIISEISSLQLFC